MPDHTTSLAHHFDDLSQQKQASTLGMWFFLVTEIMFFGGLFTGYTVYRSGNGQAFASASAFLFQALSSRVEMSYRRAMSGSTCGLHSASSMPLSRSLRAESIPITKSVPGRLQFEAAGKPTMGMLTRRANWSA